MSKKYKKIGIDLGIKDLCIISDGDKYENPKILKKYEKKIARLGRSISRKQKGSNNFQKINHKLASSITDVSWYELIRQLTYKANWYGRTYIKVDTFYASSQLCHVCGYQNKDTKNISVRRFKCPKCDTYHDRDMNAAKNILKKD